MNPTSKLSVSGPGAKAILDGIKSLQGDQVLVGIPEAKAQRPKGQVSNAQLAFFHTHGVRDIAMRTQMKAMQINRNLNYSQALALYIHTKGSPLWQIPPRPIVEPAIENQTNRRLIE